MADDEKPSEEQTGWHSRSADAAGARYGEAHPDEDPPHPPPSHVPEPDDEVPNRHSASAEAANLSWRERHPDDED
jgi:hypothetical protein